MTSTSVASVRLPVVDIRARETRTATTISRRGRVLAAAAGVAALGVLALAAWMEPASSGLGTHRQLGLPECSWITMMNTPCPTCGMTTAFAHAADGHLLAAFHAQPLGALLALATAMTAILGGYIALSGSRIAIALARLWGRRSGWLLAALVVAAWLYKIAAHRGWIG
jgi:hypothetical protein